MHLAKVIHLKFIPALWLLFFFTLRKWHEAIFHPWFIIRQQWRLDPHPPTPATLHLHFQTAPVRAYFGGGLRPGTRQQLLPAPVHLQHLLYLSSSAAEMRDGQLSEEAESVCDFCLGGREEPPQTATTNNTSQHSMASGRRSSFL